MTDLYAQILIIAADIANQLGHQLNMWHGNFNRI
jgi:hypothetical protein